MAPAAAVSDEVADAATAAARDISTASSATELNSAGGDGEGEAAGSRLLHPRYGYAVLGGVNPDARPKSRRGEYDPADYVPRLHPSRLFAPGQVYEPEDLNYLAPPSDALAQAALSGAAHRGGSRRAADAAPLPGAAEVSAHQRDYKAVWLQQQFLSTAGRLLPRADTRLPRGLHNRVMKAVRRSRYLALIPYEARHGRPGAARLREVANRQLAAAASRSAPQQDVQALQDALQEAASDAFDATPGAQAGKAAVEELGSQIEVLETVQRERHWQQSQQGSAAAAAARLQ